ERGTAVQGLFNGAHNARMAMPEDERAPRADIVEISVAVEIEEVRPFTAGNEDRLAADSTESAGRAVDAAGDGTAGPLEGFTAAIAHHGLGLPWSGTPAPRLAVQCGIALCFVLSQLFRRIDLLVQILLFAIELDDLLADPAPPWQWAILGLFQDIF